MWWFRTAVAAAALALCAACGFHPMYATGRAGGEPQVVEGFAATTVLPIPNRAGQLLRNELQAMLAPNAPSTPALYALEVGLDESLSEVAVERTGLATRANLRLTAEFALRDVSTGANVLEGKTDAVSSYDLVENRFSTLTAQQDARKRAVLRIAGDIRNRLGAFYSSTAAARAGGA